MNGKGDRMFRTLLQAFISPVAGPVGFALATVMCGLLLGTVYSAEQREASLKAEIARLSQQNQRDTVALRARLVACESAPTSLAARRAEIAGLSWRAIASSSAAPRTSASTVFDGRHATHADLPGPSRRQGRGSPVASDWR